MSLQKPPVYSTKIKIPKFEPDDRNIQLEDCVNVDKYNELIRRINKELSDGNITEHEAKFLKLCATRWIVFDYSNVAQYYATNASETVQRLLEQSTMILIDVDKAFENTTTTVRKFVNDVSNQFIENNLDMFDMYDFSEDKTVDEN